MLRAIVESAKLRKANETKFFNVTNNRDFDKTCSVTSCSLTIWLPTGSNDCWVASDCVPQATCFGLLNILLFSAKRREYPPISHHAHLCWVDEWCLDDKIRLSPFDELVVTPSFPLECTVYIAGCDFLHNSRTASPRASSFVEEWTSTASRVSTIHN